MEMDPFFSVPDKAPSNAATPKAKAPPTTPNELRKSETPVTAQQNPSTGPSGSAPSTLGADTPSSTPATAEATKAFSLEEANEEIALLLTSGKVTQKEVSALQGMMRDHVALREKVAKLKSLLGRSAKAQREAKMDLEQTQKRLEGALREVERLNKKVEKLANRPTHMELLADFETNFDKALLSVQSGGQDTAATPAATASAAVPAPQEAVVDGMLMQELAESQARTERLEGLNNALVQRSAQLETRAKQLQQEKDTAVQQLERVQLELKMAQMEAEHASRAVQDKMASLQEMQLEINLVTKASMDANRRAQKGEAAAKTVRTDREMVQQLQAQVQALQEWALASAEAKRLSQERVNILELKLEALQGDAGGVRRTSGVAGERKLASKNSSMVIGAGDIGHAIVELEPEQIQMVRSSERVVLRWKFDMTPETLQIDFSIWKGKILEPSRVGRPDYLLPERVVTGGAGDEQENAFAVQNCCTLVWSNKKSWVRPRTIKYTVEIFAVKD